MCINGYCEFTWGDYSSETAWPYRYSYEKYTELTKDLVCCYSNAIQLDTRAGKLFENYIAKLFCVVQDLDPASFQANYLDIFRFGLKSFIIDETSRRALGQAEYYRREFVKHDINLQVYVPQPDELTLDIDNLDKVSAPDLLNGSFEPLPLKAKYDGLVKRYLDVPFPNLVELTTYTSKSGKKLHAILKFDGVFYSHYRERFAKFLGSDEEREYLSDRLHRIGVRQPWILFVPKNARVVRFLYTPNVYYIACAAGVNCVTMNHANNWV